MRFYFPNSSLKIFCIFLLFSYEIAFGSNNTEKCTYSNLDENNWVQLVTNVRERMEKRIKTFFDDRKITIEGGIYLPVKIFNQWEDYEPKYNNDYISTSFSVYTDKSQTLCHADQPFSQCNFEPRYKLFFNYNLIRDEQGIPLKEVCNISADINLKIVNITQQFHLDSINIFNSDEIIHQWIIKDLKPNLAEDLN